MVEDEGKGRQVTEAALKRSSKELDDIRHALDQSTIVATTDRQGTITHVNRKFCEISGYREDELLGHNHRLINSGTHPPEFFREMWKTISAGRMWHGEIQNKAKGGSLYWVDTTVVPFLDDSGRPYQHIAIRHDITERKRFEFEQRDQASLRRLGEMAAVVAHELKNPLAGIRGAIEVIGSRLPSASADAQIVKEMLVRLDSLNDMAQDLLLFARTSPPHPVAMSLKALAEHTVALFVADVAMSQVRVELGGPDVVISADEQMMQRVLLNLMVNAAQAMGKSGRIGLTLSSGSQTCRIDVTDEGPGIAAEVRERVFEPFVTTKHRGTGLGLAIARRTVELHGGRIEAGCPPGGGTVVTVTLPLAVPSAPDVARPLGVAPA